MPPNFIYYLARQRAYYLVESKSNISNEIPPWIHFLSMLSMIDRQNTRNDIAAFISSSFKRWSPLRDLFQDVLERFGTSSVKTFYNGIRGVRNANVAAIARVTPAMLDNLTEVIMIFGIITTKQDTMDHLFGDLPVAKVLLSTLPNAHRKAKNFLAERRAASSGKVSKILSW
jgi:hypothetical protein